MYLRNLYPVPKSFSEDGSERFPFGSRVTARTGSLPPEYAARAKYLWRRFSCDASELELVTASDGFKLLIGSADCRLQQGDSYAIKACKTGVCVAAKDAVSLLDGIKTLVQLICPIDLTEGSEAFYVSAAEIHDAPAIAFRAIHLCIFPDTSLFNIEKAIHLAGFLKFTHVVLEFWGTFRYECLPALSWRGRSFSKEELAPLVELARSYGMEIIPMVNHCGHASQSRSRYGRHTVLDQDPRLSCLFEPDGWTWCLSNPDTYKLQQAMRNELEDLCGPGSYFHLGFDEAYSFATCDRCRRRVSHELLAEYLNRLTEDVCASGRRPIVWHDQFIRCSDFGEGSIIANGGDRGTADALNMLDRRIIIADWQYGYTDGFDPTSKLFMEKGFDTIICPWDDPENVRSVSGSVKTLGAFGVMFTSWDHLPAFLQDAGSWANCAWMKELYPPKAPITESACLLRRLYDTHGDFDRAG
ncbi:MAG: family 20 glycosylhydrolase [Clostridiales bacterium]|nr:family 20 glycosylhydrolase [Clostridiales bacterium]